MVADLIHVFKQKTAYELLRSLVGSELCIRDRFCRMSYDSVVKMYDAVINHNVQMAA